MAAFLSRLPCRTLVYFSVTNSSLFDPHPPQPHDHLRSALANTSNFLLTSAGFYKHESDFAAQHQYCYEARLPPILYSKIDILPGAGRGWRVAGGPGVSRWRWAGAGIFPGAIPAPSTQAP